MKVQFASTLMLSDPKTEGSAYFCINVKVPKNWRHMKVEGPTELRVNQLAHGVSVTSEVSWKHFSIIKEVARVSPTSKSVNLLLLCTVQVTELVKIRAT